MSQSTLNHFKDQILEASASKMFYALLALGQKIGMAII